MRKLLTIGGVLTVVGCALGWYFLAPQQLGGHTTYVATHGISMEPRFHTGDLAVLRPTTSYEVGDVVAYRSATLHTVVMHRIVGRDGTGFVFKGDNNSWLDPDHPTQADLLGRLALRVPDGGRYLGVLHSTQGRVIAALLVALLLLGGAGGVRRRRALRTSGGRAVGKHRGGRHRAAKPPRRARPEALKPAILTPVPSPVLTPATPRMSPSARGRLIAALCLLATCAAAQVWLWKMPTTQSTTKSVAVEQHGTFGYSAEVPASLVYPQGRVEPGDPVFTRIVHSLDVSFTYNAGASLQGTVALDAVLHGPSGWSRPLVTGSTSPIASGKGAARLQLDVDAVQSALDQFSAATGVRSTAASVVIVPRVRVTGRIDGQPVKGGFDGLLTLAAGADQLTVASPPAPTTSVLAAQPEVTDPLTTSSSLTVKVPAVGPHLLSVLGKHLAVRTARIATGVAGAVGIGLLIAALIGSRREGRAEDDVVTALRQYGDRIVDAEPVPLEGPIVELTSLAALHSIAERYDRVILHTARGERHSYLVRDELSWYRYEIRPERGQHAARRGSPQPDVVLPEASVISLEPRLRPVDILPGSVGASAWAEGYGRTG